MTDLVCSHCRMPIAVCAVGACPGAAASRALLDDIRPHTQIPLDVGPDWTRWQDEDLIPYLIRLASQVVFGAGTVADKIGGTARDRLWQWGDSMLEIAHPPLPPVDIDLGES